MKDYEKDLERMPLYQKADEIFNTVQEIADLVPEENEYLQSIASHMVGDAMIIQAKIAGAEAGDLYDIRMENAAIIRKAARDILVVDHAFEAFDFEDVVFYNGEKANRRISSFIYCMGRRLR